MPVEKPKKDDCGCNGRPACKCVNGKPVFTIPENG